MGCNNPSSENMFGEMFLEKVNGRTIHEEISTAIKLPEDEGSNLLKKPIRILQLLIFPQSLKFLVPHENLYFVEKKNQLGIYKAKCDYFFSLSLSFFNHLYLELVGERSMS